MARNSRKYRLETGQVARDRSHNFLRWETLNSEDVMSELDFALPQNVRCFDGFMELSWIFG
jgi:hypothetical protein